MRRIGLFCAISIIAGLCAAPGAAETYGNFATMGVIADCPEGKAPADIGRVRAFLVEEGKRRPVQDLVEVGSLGYFATSLFYLQPDTEYTVEVEFLDKAGNVISKSTHQGRTRREPVIPETAKSLFVSPDGSDGNPGTFEKPLRTLKAGFARLSPGTTLFIRGGTYFEGELAPGASGDAKRPIVIRNYGDEKVVIDAADPDVISQGWKESSTSSMGDPPVKYTVYQAPFKGRTWAVTFEDVSDGSNYRLYPLKTKNELTTRTSARKTFAQLGFTGAYHCDGESIYVETPGKEISQYRCYVSRFTRGIVLEAKSHAYIDGLEFRHFGKDDIGCAVAVTDSSETLIQNCKVYYCNSGVWVKGTSSNNTIQDCLFVDDVDHWHFSYTKGPDGWNYHGQVETGAVCVDGSYSGRGLVFRRNRIDGIFDGSHLSPWVEINARTSEIDWCENTLVDIADDLLETDGFSRNVRIFDNYMDKSLSGVSLAQATDGPTWIVNNVIANSGVCFASTNPADYEYEGYPFKTNGGYYPEVGSGPVFFYHNTSYTTDPKSRAMLVKSTARWKKFTFRNNIWCGKAMGFDCWTNSLSLMDWDYDDLFHAAGPFFKQGRNREYMTLAEFQAAFATMMNGISADPKFVNADGGDYHLRDDSPCIDKGILIPGINDGRFKGKAPDMGCFEAQSLSE